MHDTFAKKAINIQGKIWMEGQNSVDIYAPGVVLSCVLSGMDSRRFSNTPMGSTLVVLQSYSDMRIFEEYPKTGRDIEVSTLNGGYDWATVLFPEEEVTLFEE